MEPNLLLLRAELCWCCPVIGPVVRKQVFHFLAKLLETKPRYAFRALSILLFRTRDICPPE